MANEKKLRLNTVCKHLKISKNTLVDFLNSKGIKVDNASIISPKVITEIEKEFGTIKINEPIGKDSKEKVVTKRESISLEDVAEKNGNISISKEKAFEAENLLSVKGPKILGKIDLNEKSRFGKNKNNKHKSNNKRSTEPANKTKKQQEPIKTEKKPVTKEKKKSIVTSKKPIEQHEVRIASEEQKNKTFDERAASDDSNIFRNDTPTVSGPKILGTIDLSALEKKKKNSSSDKHNKRKRIKKDGKVDINNPNMHAKKDGNNDKKGNNQNKHNNHQGGKSQHGEQRNNNNQGQRSGNHKQNAGGKRKSFNKKSQNPVVKAEITDDDVQKQIKDTLARLTAKGHKNKGTAKHRKDKRDAVSARMNVELEKKESEKNILKVTEFVTVSDLARMMNVQVTEVITACMNLGLMVSINQRLDAEALVIVAEEFNFKVDFVTAELQESIEVEEDKEEDLVERPAIITVMGHVDHGKTSLLDFIRKTNVIAGEAGGITQHIGAYNVKLSSGRRITFLDTPGHEAFTAMRARGASVTDVAIIIIAADDNVMPQTKEAINHASAAGVPIIFAINKIDKDGANPDRIREELGQMNYLTEDWGGKYQCQEISAKQGFQVKELLEKVLLEADMLNLRANPNRKAEGTVIESALDKGRGYTSTVLVQKGTLHVGDAMLSGEYSGKVKAMFNERGQRIKEAGPSSPVLVLGLDGAPQAGDTFNILDDEKQAREVANKREQLQRMQGLKTQKHITLDEIGRRIAIGNFQELNVIIKGDVDGSVEALTDSLLRESHAEVQVNVIHKAVGQISESDVLLAAASNAIIIGFQVRPSGGAKRLAEKEEIEIRQYSIIYDAIEEIQGVIKGMIAPKFKEVISASVEVMETFKISKVGTIAGCLVREGKLTRNTNIRIIRDGIVVHTGKLGSLKRYKDNVKEVTNGMECGLNIEGYNDIKIGDFIEGYEDVEIK